MTSPRGCSARPDRADRPHCLPISCCCTCISGSPSAPGGEAWASLPSNSSTLVCGFQSLFVLETRHDVMGTMAMVRTSRPFRRGRMFASRYHSHYRGQVVLPCPSSLIAKIAKRSAGIRCEATASNGSRKPASKAAKLVGGGLLAAGLLVAALPTLLSTRLGLSASLAAVNLVTPGQVEVSKLDMGWRRPVSIQGLRLRDRQSRQALPLVEVQEISSTAGLWRLLQAASQWATHDSHDCSRVIVQGASFNCEYDASMTEFKLLDWLEGAGVISPAPRKKPAAAAAQLPVDAAAASAASQPPASPPARDRVAGMLSRADASIDLSADLRLGRGLQFLLPNALLKVPHEIRDMLGGQMHVSGAMGAEALLEWADETEQDVSWAAAAAAAASGAPGIGLPAPGSSQHLSPAASQEAVAPAAASPSTGHLQRPTMHAGYQPCMIQVYSDHMQAEAKLYCKERGSGPMLLHEPAAATMDFTAALSRFGLEMINPLLGDALALQGREAGGGPNRAVHVLYAPDDMRLPAVGGAVLTVKPLRLLLAGGSRIQEICRAMNIGGAVSQLRSLEIQTSGMQVHVSAGDGPITTNRVDMSVGPGSGAGALLELSMWGTHDVSTGALDMTLGLPASVLQQLGIKDLPEGYLLPVQMKGTVDKPEVLYEGLVRRLAGLMVRQQYLAAQQQQEKLRRQQQQQQGDTGRGFLGKVLSVLSTAELPSLDAVKQTEADMAADLARIPQPWREGKAT